MGNYLGLDIGTSSVKAVLIDGSDRLIGTAQVPLGVARPHPLWSEQDPDHWIAASEAAIEALKAGHAKALADVEGIGLSGQMHGATLLGADARPLRPAILWNDGRSATECAELTIRCPELTAIAGNIAMPGFTAPKLLWLRKHEPEVFARMTKVLLPKDYVRLWLTGEYVSDMSDASGTLWLDVGARQWSEKLLAACDMGLDHMPRLVEGSAVSGRLRSSLAARFGIGTAPPVAGGGGDNAASAVGMGVVRKGSAFLSLGTSGVLFVANERFSPNTGGAVHAFCHALPGVWHQMGVILSAAASLSWLSSIFREDVPALLAGLGPRVEKPASLFFLPYLSGERTPHNDPFARGGFIGLSHETDRAALIQAVLEGVAFAFHDCLRVLSEGGGEIHRAFAVGGGARSSLWLSILANVLGVPLDLTEEADAGGAYGAARLGRLAATGADPLISLPPPEVITTVEPDPVLVRVYAERYGEFRALYPALRHCTPKENSA